MSFKINDLVVCVVKGGTWVSDCNMQTSNGPKYNEINKIDAFDSQGGLVFFKYGTEGFNPVDFRKVDESFADGVLENILKNISVEELEKIEEEYLIKK